MLARLIFRRGLNELVAAADRAACRSRIRTRRRLATPRCSAACARRPGWTTSTWSPTARATPPCAPGATSRKTYIWASRRAAEGSTRGTINLDITEDLKARGASARTAIPASACSSKRTILTALLLGGSHRQAVFVATRLANAKEQVAADPGPKDGPGARVLTKSDDVSVAKKRVEVEPAHHLLPRVPGIDGIYLAGSLSLHESNPLLGPLWPASTVVHTGLRSSAQPVMMPTCANDHRPALIGAPS